jgi:DNA sulfur modification protein DndE
LQRRRFQSIVLKNIVCTGAERAVLLEGLPEMAIRDIELENILISSRKGLECIAADQIRLKNVRILPRTGPVLSLEDSRNVTMEKVSGPEGVEPFVRLEGQRTGRIRILETDLSKAKKGIELGKNVPADAVIKP